MASYMLLVLPLESQRIDDSQRSIILGTLMGIAGATQLVTPMVGLISDRCTSSWGRRRPFIVAGGVLGIAGILAQDMASMTRWVPAYYASYTMSMVALSVAYTAVVGVMADMVPPEQTGTATGVAALHTVAGANIGFLIWYATDGTDSDRLHAMYQTYALIIAITVTVTTVACKEIPLRSHVQSVVDCSRDDEEERAEAPCSNVADASEQEHLERGARGCLSPPLQWRDIVDSYYIDPRKHADFTFVFWSRTFYYCGVSVQTFFKYYLKDVIGVEDAEACIVRIAVVGQLTAAITAIPSGLISDRIGKMRKPFVYGSCAVLALGNLANCFVRNETDVIIVCAIMGAANGVYLAMDAALALDTLPSVDEAARFMGVWGIGCFVGGALGPMVGGPMLSLAGQNPAKLDAYNYIGYAAVLGFASVCFVASGVILYFVGGRRTESSMAIANSCAISVCLRRQLRKAFLHGALADLSTKMKGVRYLGNCKCFASNSEKPVGAGGCSSSK